MEPENNKKLGELLEDLANGNVQALQGISDQIEPVLKTIGNIYYKNRADIEDAIHNLYVKLNDKASHFKNNTNAYAWIVRIYENSIKSHLRIRQREAKFLQEEISYLQSDASIADDRYIDTHLYLREILDKCTEEERWIIIYYYWCECTIREVAEILRKPKSTIFNKLKALEEKIGKI